MERTMQSTNLNSLQVFSSLIMPLSSLWFIYERKTFQRGQERSACGHSHTNTYAHMHKLKIGLDISWLKDFHLFEHIHHRLRHVITASNIWTVLAALAFFKKCVTDCCKNFWQHTWLNVEHRLPCKHASKSEFVRPSFSGIQC